MRRSLPFLVLLLATAAACSKSSPDRSAPSQPTMSSDARPQAAESAAPAGQASRDAGPNIGVTAAPGVAFNYRYEFSLPPLQIAAVQEQHAQMCEQLGATHCRITGMFYRVNNAHDVEATLAFKLDPAIARRFGRDSVAIVTGNAGSLAESEITGTDVGTEIHQANRSIAEMQADLQRLEAQLRQPNLDPDEKARLEEQAQQLREQIRAGTAQRDEAQASLATTPMTFRYVSGEPTLGQSLNDTGDTLLHSGKALLLVAIALLPWAAAALLIWAVVFYVRRRWFPKKPAADLEAG
ncbi:MAG: DUF4404 family protein [Sphingomonadaceae bacterium]|nr:DUF4404 family protein [Sphingomonadaceae bacterium]